MTTDSSIAIVHEWVEQFGGAEAVLDQLVKIFPDSELHVLWSNHIDRYSNPTKESFLAHTFLRDNKAASVPLQLLAWRTLSSRTSILDKIIVSSHLFAHHAKFRSHPDAKKFVYVHTPARYIWEPERDSRGSSTLVRLASELIKPLDRRRSTEAHKLAANSSFTRGKIMEFWQRESEVIYPPVRILDIRKNVEMGLSLSTEEESLFAGIPTEFILGASRFIDYKKLDQVIQIGEWLDVPVVIAGSGPRLKYLQDKARESSTVVHILEKPSDQLLLTLYSKALAYVFPPVEDFGVMPLEASAAGAPVLANHLGGASETVLEGVNGAVVDMQSKNEILAGFNRLQGLVPSDAFAHLEKFDVKVFRERITDWVNET